MPRMTVDQQRAHDAKGKIAFLSGQSDVHPHGWSGRRHLVPCELDNAGCWDTSPRGWVYSEYGNDAGFALEPVEMKGCRNAA